MWRATMAHIHETLYPFELVHVFQHRCNDLQKRLSLGHIHTWLCCYCADMRGRVIPPLALIGQVELWYDTGWKVDILLLDWVWVGVNIILWSVDITWIWSSHFVSSVPSHSKLFQPALVCFVFLTPTSLPMSVHYILITTIVLKNVEFINSLRFAILHRMVA